MEVSELCSTGLSDRDQGLQPHRIGRVDWMNFSGWMFGAVGLVLAIAAEWGRRHPPKAVLSSTVSVIPIGLPKDPEIQVTYRGEPLENPAVARILMVNQGDVDIDEFGAEAVRYRVEQDSPGVVKGIVDKGAAARYDPDKQLITFKPCMLKKGEGLRLTLLCDGPPKITHAIRLANVEIDTDGYYARSGKTLSPFPWLLATTFLLGTSFAVSSWGQAPTWMKFITIAATSGVTAFTTMLLLGIWSQRADLARRRKMKAAGR